MKTQLKATLQDAIDCWLQDSAESDPWPNCYFGGETAALMVEAAAAVFDAVVEFQEYARAEGLFDETQSA